MSKAFLIFGATGKQGSSVVRSILSHPSFSAADHTILAVTRNVESASAQRAAKLSPAVKLIQGDLQDAKATFEKLQSPPYGVYAVTMPGKTEAEDGIAIADEAAKAGVSRFVFGSVDRGVLNGGNSPTDVPHFITKHKIEAHIKKLADESKGKFDYTILRLPFFLDNIDGGSFQARLFATVWRDSCTRPMSVIDTRDVGPFAAAAFFERENPAYRNTSLNIAGDRLTFEELDAKTKAKTGHGMPTTYSIFATLLKLFVHDVRKMAEFFQEPGFMADPKETRKLQNVTSADEWLDRSSYVQKSV